MISFFFILSDIERRKIMILVILGIGIALTVFGLFIEIDEIGGTGAIIFIIALIFAAFLGAEVKELSIIDDKIAMYEEQNTKIEEQIAEVVQEYMEYESGVFTEVGSDSAITLISLYPELKSDGLVASQIELYTENNRKITELKEKKINGSVTRWWLYFGG